MGESGAPSRWSRAPGARSTRLALSALLADERVVDRPVLVLGGGSNLLQTRDPAGLVVRYTHELELRDLLA